MHDTATQPNHRTWVILPGFIFQSGAEVRVQVDLYSKDTIFDKIDSQKTPRR